MYVPRLRGPVGVFMGFAPPWYPLQDPKIIGRGMYITVVIELGLSSHIPKSAKAHGFRKDDCRPP